MSNRDGFLTLLAVEPTLLPPAPQGVTVADMERRRHDEVHSCLYCGRRADCVLVAETKLGPRWLDLCMPHRHWLEQDASG